MKPVRQSANEQEFEFAAANIELNEDLSLEYTINVDRSALSFITHRAPERISAYDLRDPALAAKNSDGYFEARATFNQQYGTGRHSDRLNTPRNVLLLLDNLETLPESDRD